MPVFVENENKSWRALECISVGEPGSPSFLEAAELLGDPDDHDELLAQAMRHNLVPAVAEFLVCTELIAPVPPRLKLFFVNALHANKRKNQIATEDAVRVHGELSRNGVRGAFTKGIVGHVSLYGGRGVRVFNDIDLMINKEDSEKAPEMMKVLGYEKNKRYDPQVDGLVEMPRKVTAMYRLSPDHIPHFVRLVRDECIPFLMVDFALSLTWHASPWQVPMEEVLRNLNEVHVEYKSSSHALPVLHPSFDFIFTCLHLFREGWVERTVLKSDIRLSQFADVHHSWRRRAASHRDLVSDHISDHGLQLPMAWVCAHTDALFGTTLVEELQLGAYADPEWLRSALGPDGSYRYWSGNIRERLATRSAPTLTTGKAPDLPGDMSIFRAG